MKACVCCNYDTVKVLLDAGADPTHRTTQNISALYTAFRHNTDRVFFLIYDALFQKNPTESELLQYLTPLPSNIQNIIKQTQGDRLMLKEIQRLYNLMDGRCHMNARELGYRLEQLATYDHMDEITTTLLHIGNDQNDPQMIHAVLHILYRRKNMEIILNGQRHATETLCRPNILRLYTSYFWRLGEINK